MKIKYILGGGIPQSALDGGVAFCEEIVTGFNGPVKILDCLFARSPEKWESAFSEDKAFFARCLPDTNLKIQLADPNQFIEQIRLTDVLYIRGGTTLALLDTLNRIEQWQTSLEGKTVVGLSAGANVLSKYYYGLDSLKVEEGFGLVTVKVITHFRSNYHAPNIDWDKAYLEIQNREKSLRLITLAEGEFTVIVSSSCVWQQGDP